MAGLGDMARPIPAGQQFRAIAYLRWRLFANSFRRKSGKGELFARVILYPVFALFVIGPALAAGGLSWLAVSRGSLEYIPTIFLVIFLLQILVSINISPPALSFDPEAIIRFPVNFRRYLAVRIVLGMLSAANVIGTVALLSSALGMTLARTGLGPIAFGSALLLACTNIFLLRMIFAWVDRWLSTRRAREVFTGLIILFSVGVQYVNVTLNPGFNRHNSGASQQKIRAAIHFYQLSRPFLSHLHPELAGYAIVNAAHGASLISALNLLGVALFGTLFLAVFAWRMEREYRGENLSDSAVAPARQTHPPTGVAAPPVDLPLAEPAPSAAKPGEASALPVLLSKELIYIRRNSAQLYALLLPVAMVFLFAGRMGARQGQSWAFPSAIVYSLLTVGALSYNSFGLDAEGVQFYFLAPVRFRTILLAKNLFGFGLTLLQALIVYAVIHYVAGPPPFWMTLATLFWLVFAVMVNVTLGNRRSITAPKKMDPSKLSRKQASQLSVLLSVLWVLGAGGLGAGIIWFGMWTRLSWLPTIILFALACAGVGLYLVGLGGIDALAGRNRETMIEELAKTS